MNLRETRLKKGYSHEEIAKLLDISRSTYTKYENGINNPDIRTIIKLSEIFEVSTDYLLDVNIYEHPGKDPIIQKIIKISIELSAQGKEKLLDYANMIKFVENSPND